MERYLIMTIGILFVLSALLTISRIKAAIIVSQKNHEIYRLEKRASTLSKELSRSKKEVSRLSFEKLNLECENEHLKDKIKNQQMLLNQRWNTCKLKAKEVINEN